MATGFEFLADISFLGVAFLAVLWRYSALPDIEWEKITAGILLMVVGSAISVFGSQFAVLLNELLLLNVAFGVSFLGTVVGGIGALIVVVGALEEAWEFLRK